MYLANAVPTDDARTDNKNKTRKTTRVLTRYQLGSLKQPHERGIPR